MPCPEAASNSDRIWGRLELMHRAIDLKVHYYGTPVVLISTRNEDGSANPAPMSSAWWLGALVAALRIAECPIQLECQVVGSHPFGDRCTAFEVRVVRSYLDESLRIPGKDYVDPLGWDPLIMKFCEFFGGGSMVHGSRLAQGWRMPHPQPVR